MTSLTWEIWGGELRAETEQYRLRIENWPNTFCLVINGKERLYHGTYHRDTPEQCKALAVRLLEALGDE